MTKIWKEKIPEYWYYFGNRLVEISDINEGAYVLDIGSGRGTSLLPAARKAGPRGLVIGVDNWDRNAKGTAKEIKQHNLDNAFIIEMDASRLGLRENLFDFVLSGFAYVYCSFEDLYSMLKSGGKIAVSSWKWQEDSEWMGEMVKKILPEKEYEDLSDMGMPSDDGRPWVYYRDSDEALGALLRNAGFKNIEMLTEENTYIFEDEKEWWSKMGWIGWQGYIKKIENMGPEMFGKFKDYALEMIRKYKKPDGIHYSRAVLLAVATK